MHGVLDFLAGERTPLQQALSDSLYCSQFARIRLSVSSYKRHRRSLSPQQSLSALSKSGREFSPSVMARV
jgi:hypothetical protein